MSWLNKIVKLGLVKENTIRTLEFKTLKPLKIVDINPSCGDCTKIIGYKDNVLTVKFIAGEIPHHLKSKPGYQDIRKTIVVTMEDGEKDILVFTGKKIK